MKWKRREREKKNRGSNTSSRSFRKYLPFVCRHSHSSYPPFLVLRWACYHCTDRFLGWKIANRFGLAWISRGKDGDCIDFSIRDGFSYLERIINGPRFSAFPTTDRLVRSVKYSRNCFLPSFFSSPSSSCFFSNEIIPVQIILIYVTYPFLVLRGKYNLHSLCTKFYFPKNTLR